RSSRVRSDGTRTAQIARGRSARPLISLLPRELGALLLDARPILVGVRVARALHPLDRGEAPLVRALRRVLFPLRGIHVAELLGEVFLPFGGIPAAGWPGDLRVLSAGPHRGEEEALGLVVLAEPVIRPAERVEDRTGVGLERDRPPEELHRLLEPHAAIRPEKA